MKRQRLFILLYIGLEALMEFDAADVYDDIYLHIYRFSSPISRGLHDEPRARLLFPLVAMMRQHALAHALMPRRCRRMISYGVFDEF